MQDAGFLGRGWSFPPRFDPRTGAVEMVTAEEDIIESLRILFSTRPGERIMHPAYGSSLFDLVFEPMDAETEVAIELAVSRAILFYEPRIELEAVRVDTTDWLGGRLAVTVSYRIRETNTRNNIVFPFYLEQGTLLSADPASFP